LAFCASVAVDVLCDQQRVATSEKHMCEVFHSLVFLMFDLDKPRSGEDVASHWRFQPSN
jgi:hypothetical protein